MRRWYPPSSLPILLVALAVPFAHLRAAEEEKAVERLDCALDVLGDPSALWKLKADELNKHFPKGERKKNPFFRMNRGKTRVVFNPKPEDGVEVGYSLFKGALPVQDASLQLSSGQVRRAFFSIYHDGASAKLEPEGVDALEEKAAALLTSVLGFDPKPFGPKKVTGGVLSGKLWRNGEYAAFLSRSVGDSKTKWIQLAMVKPGDEASLLVVRPSLAAFQKEAETDALHCALDEFVTLPGAFKLTSDLVDLHFNVPGVRARRGNPYFQWLTGSRSRAHLRRLEGDLVKKVSLTILDGEIPVDEALVDFREGKLHGVTISIYNRGDSEKIGRAEFERRFQRCSKLLTDILGVRPKRRDADRNSGLQIESWLWSSTKGKGAIEYNPGAREHVSPEFLRLRLAPRESKGGMAAAMSERHSARPLSKLTESVRTSKRGDTFIGDIPMVDQGMKGYCVAATCQRLFEYYEIPSDQHQLALAMGTTAQSGTSGQDMKQALKKIDYRYKTRFEEVDLAPDAYWKDLRRYIDDGVPVLWTLLMSAQAESAQGTTPAKEGEGAQRRAVRVVGHMRMIIGYNEKKGEIIYSDPWGAGHEFKRLPRGKAYGATTGMYVLKPTVR